MNQHPSQTRDTVYDMASAVFSALAAQIAATDKPVNLPEDAVVTIGGHQYTRTGPSMSFPWTSPTYTERFSDEAIRHFLIIGTATSGAS
jgi:hypothetical protein